MSTADYFAQLEEELTWRSDELRFFHNQLAGIEREDERMLFRKALLVMLYSHLEGFCKNAFSIYIGAINDARVARRQLSGILQACSLGRIFSALETGDPNGEVFRWQAPKSRVVKGVGKELRRAEFIQEFESYLSAVAELKAEEMVDMESNLRPAILRKILLRLGMSIELVDPHESAIQQLVERRNGFAHGVARAGIRQHDYEEMRSAAYEVMSSIRQAVFEAIINQIYMASDGGVRAAPE